MTMCCEEKTEEPTTHQLETSTTALSSKLLEAAGVPEAGSAPLSLASLADASLTFAA